MVKRLLIVLAVGLCLAVGYSCYRHHTAGPLAENAEEAPEHQAQPEAKESKTPDYGWPADFKLPLEIHVDAPPVPEEIQGPSPPIEEKK